MGDRTVLWLDQDPWPWMTYLASLSLRPRHLTHKDNQMYNRGWHSMSNKHRLLKKQEPLIWQSSHPSSCLRMDKEISFSSTWSKWGDAPFAAHSSLVPTQEDPSMKQLLPITASLKSIQGSLLGYCSVPPVSACTPKPRFHEIDCISCKLITCEIVFWLGIPHMPSLIYPSPEGKL